MADEKQFDWIGSGPSGIALADATLMLLQRKGIITAQERLEAIDGAIKGLESNPELKGSADNLRKLFGRP